MNRVLNFFGNDPFNMIVYGSFGISHAIYWVLITIYSILDLTKNTKADNKLSTRPNDKADKKMWFKAITNSLFNQLFVAFPMIYISAKFNHWMTNGVYPPLELPSIPKMLYQFIGCLIIYDAIFYYNHRLLHTKQLYKRFHKAHHYWKNPIAAATMDCHPLEHVLTSTLPHIVGPFIMQPNIYVAWFYFAFSTICAINDHNGYYIPFLIGREKYHDYHHLKFDKNYGIFGIFDWLHGTGQIWRKSESS